MTRFLTYVNHLLCQTPTTTESLSDNNTELWTNVNINTRNHAKPPAPMQYFRQRLTGILPFNNTSQIRHDQQFKPTASIAKHKR